MTDPKVIYTNSDPKNLEPILNMLYPYVVEIEPPASETRNYDYVKAYYPPDEEMTRLAEPIIWCLERHGEPAHFCRARRWYANFAYPTDRLWDYVFPTFYFKDERAAFDFRMQWG